MQVACNETMWVCVCSNTYSKVGDRPSRQRRILLVELQSKMFYISMLQKNDTSKESAAKVQQSLGDGSTPP